MTGAPQASPDREASGSHPRGADDLSAAPRRDGLAIRACRVDDDLDALHDICLRTGAAGGDATDLVDEPRLFGDLFAAPYAVLEPEHAFVLDDGTGRVVGYVLGARDVVAFEARAEDEWWPALRERYPKGSGEGLDAILVALLHDRWPPDPALTDRYPSELHIDLLPEAQGRGWGRRLIDHLLASLHDAGSPGVHLGTSAANTRAIAFYRHLGFTELGANATTIQCGVALAT